MRRRPVPCNDFQDPSRRVPLRPNSQISVSQLAHYGKGWLLDCESRQHSEQTLRNRKGCLDLLTRFLTQEEIPICDTNALRRFFIYATKGWDTDGGRWGKKEVPKTTKPGTVATYHRILTAFFNWLVEENGIDVSPMQNIKPPIDRPDQIQPFTPDQIASLERSASNTSSPLRDYAILLCLLDTGLRSEELCSLKVHHLDLSNRSVVVEGKGGKSRRVYWGRKTGRALWKYLHSRGDLAPDDPVFASAGGWSRGEHLLADGLNKLISRIGKRANLQGVRCSPHTFRHTFSVNFLRNGGNQFTLMQILGHTNIRMTSRYVMLAQADIAAQHRQFSPVDNLKS